MLFRSDKFAFDPSSREEIRQKTGCGGFVLLHVGRFVTTKNHLFIIDIFKELKKLRPDAKLLLVGDGELVDGVKEYVSAKALEDAVIFCGVVSDAERYYSAADAFLLPSLYEGLPVVALEAEASGLDVYISDAVTRECAITPHVSFLPLSAGAGEWAKTISSAPPHDRSDDAGSMRGSAFDIKKTANDLRDYYSELLNNSYGRAK